jgi:hypothetical protein
MYFLYFKLKTKNQKLKFLNIHFFLLHLFLKTNYNLDFFGFKNFYEDVKNKWYVSSILDLIFLLVRKIDIFLSKFISITDLTFNLSNVLVNNNFKNIDYIINVGDFITIDTYVVFNKWFYLFFLLKYTGNLFFSLVFEIKFFDIFFNIFFNNHLILVTDILLEYNVNLFF